MVLGAVALKQMTSQDAGVTADGVAADVASCAPELFGGVDGRIDSSRFSEASRLGNGREWFGPQRAPQHSAHQSCPPDHEGAR